MSKSDHSEECLPLDTKFREADFETLVISVKNLHTVVSLLKCEELEVVVSTLTALTKFVRKSFGNITILLEYKVLEDVMCLVGHEDLRIRRSATRLLADMTALGSTRHLILNDSKDKNRLHWFMNALHDEADVVVEENLSKILCYFADDIFATYDILESPQLGIFLAGLHSVASGMRRNCLEILEKVMANPFAADRICSLKEFNFQSLYEVELEEEGGTISESAFYLMKHLLTPRENEKIHRQFRESGGLDKLLEILRNNIWEELHPPIFELLVVATNNFKTAEYFYSLVTSEEISEFLTRSDPIILQLLANLSAVREFRNILCDVGIIQFIAINLNTQLNTEFLNPICSIVGNICHSRAAMNELIELDITGRLIEILRTEDIDGLMKEDIVITMKELVACDPRTGEYLINSNDHLSFIELAQDASVSLHLRLGALNIVKKLIRVPKFRSFFSSLTVIDMLSSFFDDRVIDELKIEALSILFHLFVEEEARRLIMKTNFLEKLCPLICTEYPLPVQSCAILLIQQLCCEEILIDEFVKIGYLDALLKKRRVMREAIPSWETCLQTMLSGHLPLKFAITGYLSLHDITKDGFYVEKAHCYTFPSLNELLVSRCSPLQCIYTVNFSNEIPSRPFHGDSAESSIYWTEMLGDDSSERICFSETISTICGDKFGHLRPDPRLCQSLDMFLRIMQTSDTIDTIFSDSPDAIDISKIESRARLLGKFVAHKLSNPNDSPDDCISDKLKDHLRELRETLETSIIPLGELRLGSYLERAVLFKAIADRICLPTALVRGEYGKSWVEVAVPQCHEEPSKNHIPTRLLRPNYIVDLMENPGELIHVDSNRSRNFYEYQ